MAQDLFLGAVALAMFVSVFLGLVFGWSQWIGIIPIQPLSSWKLVVGRIGIVALTAQVLMFIALWTPLNHYRVLLRICLPIEFLLLAVAIPSVLLGKLHYRWWLLASSVFLPIASFFVVLAELAY